MRTLLAVLVALILIAPVPAEAAVSPSVQKQIDALLREIDRLKAQVEALNDADDRDGDAPYIERTSAKAADNFEMDAGGEATIYGDNLLGSSVSKTKVYLGGKRATITSGTDERLDIEVPKSLKAGKTYKLYVRHADGRSNKVNVEILSVLGRDDDDDSDHDDPTLRIKNPLSGHLWTFGDTQEFRWETEDVSSSKYGYIKLTRRGGGTYRIEDVKNTGEYEWKVGSVKGGLDGGTFDVTIVMGDAADTEGPVTLKDTGSYGDDDIDLKVSSAHTGFSGDYKLYDLSLSGGTTDRPVYKWKLRFDCGGDIEDVITKGGSICPDQSLNVYGQGSKGNYSLPLQALMDPYGVGDLKIRVEAIDELGTSMGTAEHTISVHKG